MVTLDDLLTAAPGVPAAPAKAKPDAGAGFSGLVNTIGAIKDPIARELVRGMINHQFRQIPGLEGFEIPDPEELVLRTETRAAQMKQALLSNAGSNVALAEAAWVDADPKLKKKYGLADDMWSNPADKVLAFINSEKLSPQPLSKGQLALALSDRFNVPVADPQKILDQQGEMAAAKEQAGAIKAEQQAYDMSQLGSKREAEQISRSQQEVSDLGALAKATAETAAGETAAGKAAPLAEFMDRLGQGSDESDWDEDEPSRALALSVVQGLQALPTGARPIIARAFLAKHAGFLKSNLEKVPRDDQGNMIAGASARTLGGLGPEDITGAASGNLAIVMTILGNAMGADAGAAFREIGLPDVRGVNLSAFSEQASKLGAAAQGGSP